MFSYRMSSLYLVVEDIRTGLLGMSPLRLAMFLLSILVSVVTCGVFLFALPCDLATCTAPG